MSDIFAWFNPTRWVLILLFSIALYAGYKTWESKQQEIGEHRATVECNSKIDQLKLDAARLLAAETAKVVAARAELRKFKDEQELKDAKNTKTVLTQERRLRGLSTADGRLRDPNATNEGCRCSRVGGQNSDTAASDNRTNDGTETGGLLSKELSGLFKQLTKEADDINIAYASCRADGAAVRKSVLN